MIILTLRLIMFFSFSPLFQVLRLVITLLILLSFISGPRDRDMILREDREGLEDPHHQTRDTLILRQTDFTAPLPPNIGDMGGILVGLMLNTTITPPLRTPTIPMLNVTAKPLPMPTYIGEDGSMKVGYRTITNNRT